jgi:hypothetical protein
VGDSPLSRRNRSLRTRVAVTAAAVLTTTGLAVAGPAAAAPASASVSVTSHFVVTAGSASTSGDSAFFDNGATNSQPSDLLFVTPNYTPGGVCGCVYETGAIGVWYDAANYKWAAFREDRDPMPAGESFNVLVVPRSSRSVFVQHATSANISGDTTLINSRLTNGNPRAELQVTQDYNPGNKGGTYNPHSVGVWYDSKKKRWGIFNEDGKAMPRGAAFNVMVGQAPSNGGQSSVLTTTKANRFDDTTLISNSLANGNPNVVVFATQSWNPGGKGGTYNNTQPGVWYSGTREGTFNEDQSAPPLKSAFNILVFSS